MSFILSPSILAADLSNLERDIMMLNNSRADWIHVDVMDGVFVPNISFGFPLMNVLKKHAAKPLDVHLMIVEPQKYISRFAEYQPHLLCVHYEACLHLDRTLNEIKGYGMKAGVAINPHTPVSLLEEVINLADVFVVMGVNPGFSAQKFIPYTTQKVSKLKQLITKHKSEALIEVDGGVDKRNALELLKAGADILVAGNAVFGQESPELAIDELKTLY
ncbi:MAG TPA: ribulose-phosphate 3-epimerase [Bacteroidia bacterium]|nr:ribulose-phosphate 3-epimerase [Bacteroidia bacterium]HRU69075.1 ribulose-phosphate 3-epimerase [Bacteroidia bacterium]